MTDLTQQQREALEALDRVSMHLRRGDPVSANDMLNDIERVRHYARNSTPVPSVPVSRLREVADAHFQSEDRRMPDGHGAIAAILYSLIEEAESAEPEETSDGY